MENRFLVPPSRLGEGSDKAVGGWVDRARRGSQATRIEGLSTAESILLQ